MLGYVLWDKYFVETQGSTVQSNVLFQENKLNMLLKKNGCMSSGKRNNHIKTNYLLFVDNIEWRELWIQHCPMEQMWFDVLNKEK